VVINEGDVAGLSTDLIATEKTVHKNQANGYAGLNGSGLVPASLLGTGTANASTFLRGDGTFATPAGGGGGETVTVSAPGDAPPVSPQQFDRWIRIEQVG
jgi:hypothetical protein